MSLLGKENNSKTYNCSFESNQDSSRAGNSPLDLFPSPVKLLGHQSPTTGGRHQSALYNIVSSKLSCLILNSTGQKYFLPENSDFLIFTIYVKLEDRKKISKEAHIGLAQDLQLDSIQIELS